MNLRKFDMNLILVFDAIYQTGNLTRAAEMLSINQPAVSNALNRLRDYFEDPLFERAQGQMIPTSLARQLILPVREALAILDSGLESRHGFDPEKVEREYAVGMNDMTEAIILPKLLREIDDEAPHISLSSVQLTRDVITRELSSGRLDFAIDAPLIQNKNLLHTRLRSDKYCCLVGSANKEITKNLSLEQYLEGKHIHVSSRRKGGGAVDLALHKQGCSRKITLRVQHYLTALEIVKNTDLILTMPASFLPIRGVRVFDLPIKVSAHNWVLYWHKNAEKDGGHQWMKEKIIHAALG